MYKWFFECDLAREYSRLYALLAARDVPRDALKRVQVEPPSNYRLRATFSTLTLLFTRVRM